MLKKTLMFAVVSVTLLCLAGCPPLPDARTPVQPETHSDDPAAEKAFKDARALFDEGRMDEAAHSFSEFVRLFPGDPLVSGAQIYQGRVADARGKYDLAEALFSPIIQRGPGDSYGLSATYWSGVGRYEAGDPDGAIERLEPIIDRLADPDKNTRLLEILWRAAADTGRRVKRVIWMDRYLRSGLQAEVAKAGEKELSAAIQKMESKAELETLGKTLDKEGAAWPLVMARLGALKYAAGDLEGAEEAAREAEDVGRGDVRELEELRDALATREQVDLRSVGCLLPLSGRMRLVGEAALRGVMLGAKRIPLGEEEQPVSAVIRDTKGSRAEAVARLEELVEEEHVALVVGPADAQVSAAVAKRAADLGVPVILLSAREGISGADKGVFRGFPSVSAEVTALIEAAVDTGSRKFAVASPKSAFGRSLKSRFTKELAARGLELSAAVEYEAGKTGFVEEAEALADKDFDALFIADKASAVALVAPALAAKGIWSTPAGEEAPGEGRAVRLLLPSVGYSDDLARRAGRYLQGGFAAVHYFDQASEGAREFDDLYRREYDEAPTHLAAYGHDAMVLATSAIDDGAVTRAGIARWIAGASGDALLHAAPFDGFDEKGEPRALPVVITLMGERWELLP